MDLAPAFEDRDDVQVAVMLFHDAGLAAELRAKGIEPVLIETSGPYDLKAPGRLDAALTKHGIDVAHIHGYRAAITLALGRARCSIGVVKTEHGLPETHGTPSFSSLRLALNARLDAWPREG